MAALLDELPTWTDPPLHRRGLWSSKDAEYHAALRAKYENWRRSASGSANVPRKLHQIWLGPKPPPDAHAAAWRALHPDWEYKLWRDADVAALGLENAAAFSAATNWGEASDIARYEILLRFGGVYADMDFEPLRPLDALREAADFFVGFSNVGAVEINNGLIGAAPGHALLAALVERVAAARVQRPKPPPTDLLAAIAASGFLDDAGPLAKTLSQADADWTIEHTGPGLITRTFCELHGPMLRAVCLPYEVFYAKSNAAPAASDASPFSYAVHHWAKSWQESPR